MKKSKFTKPIAGVISVITILTLIGTVGALNGWFGGGGKIPEDTFTRGLVAYWSFDEGSGTTAYDASGNGNHGTLINGPKWTQGKIGGALSFDGVDDYVNVSYSPSLNSPSVSQEITLEAWVYYKGGSGMVIDRYWTGGPLSNRSYGFRITPSVQFHYINSTGQETTFYSQDAVPQNTWTHVVVTCKNSRGRIFINGKESSLAGSYTTCYLQSTNNNINIGRAGDNSNYFNGLIDEVRIYNRALSPEEIRFHYSRGGPVAYWKFDEGQGTNVYDLSGNGNNGTLNLGTSGNTDPSKAWVPGKFGTALSFDGVDDYVNIPDNPSLAIPGDYTVCFWFKFTKSPAAPQVMIARWRADPKEYYIGYFPSGYISHYRTLADNTHYSASWAITPQVGVWYFVCGITRGNKLEIWGNGELKNAKDWPGVSSVGSSPVEIGRVTGGGQYFPGLIDEVRIYNYARTPDEIRLDYNAGYAARFGPSTDCNSDPGSCMTKGLVAYWSFDEGSGNIAYDSSGNGNHGTIYGAKWTQGKFGQALSFDGVDDWVDVGNPAILNITDAITIEAWVKPVQKGQQGIISGSSYYGGSYTLYLRNTPGQDVGFWFNNGTQRRTIAVGTVPSNVWTHIVGVADATKMVVYINGIPYTGTLYTGTEALNYDGVKIGFNSWIALPKYFNGLIDEVRIYNRALSEEEIRYHYNHTLPKGALSPLAMKEDPSLVGYWSFNEGNGTIISDQSGNNNNGTLYLGSSGNTDPSKAWSPGISGTALSFDGVDDYVEVKHADSLNLNYMSLALWLKWKSPMDDWPILINKGGKFYLQLANTRKLYFLIRSDVSSYYIFSNTILAENTWYFVVATYDGLYMKIYINGNLDNSLSVSITVATTTANLRIGGETYSGSRFSGLIDEVRIYNRALSEQEILEHYRNSKYYLASHFGPKTNCREDPGSCIDYGLVGYWSFDEGAGTTAYDASGKGNNGTIYGAKWTNGKFGQALSFDGVDDYVETQSQTLSTPLTIVAWIFYSIKSNINTIAANSTGGSSQNGFRFFVNSYNTEDRKLKIEVGNGAFGLSLASAAGAVTPNAWHYAAAVINGPNSKLFLDGIEVASGSLPSFTQTNYVDVGRMLTSGFYFKGSIDEVRIYNRALSEEEIRYLYNRGAPIAHWKFDEGKGNIAYDSSGNGNNGTIYGAQWVQGKFGSALSFDGVDDYVDIPTFPSQNKKSITISLWIKPLKEGHGTGWANSDTIIYIGGTSSSIKLGYESTNRIWLDGWRQDEGESGVVPLNTWTHVVFVQTSTSWSIYLNGILSYTRTNPYTEDTVQGTVTIGSSLGEMGNYNFNGLIDDVRIYNYARTPEQILQDYNAGLSAHFK
jgi:hypothetical protein